uniref:Uncharacterized protein n=1 Tax=Corethron hystrix TaxID=216773 RepID=A0A7S1B2L0_9STRA
MQSLGIHPLLILHLVAMQTLTFFVPNNLRRKKRQEFLNIHCSVSLLYVTYAIYLRLQNRQRSGRDGDTGHLSPVMSCQIYALGDGPKFWTLHRLHPASPQT